MTLTWNILKDNLGNTLTVYSDKNNLGMEHIERQSDNTLTIFSSKRNYLDIEHIERQSDNTFTIFSDKSNNLDMEQFERQSKQNIYTIFWQKK